MTHWLESGLISLLLNEWLLYKVTAVIEWRFSEVLPCRRMLKTFNHHHCAISSQLTTEHNELIISRERLTCPKEPFDVLLNTRGPNTVQRRGSLYCAAISHIGLCPWLPRSISIPLVLTAVRCHLRAFASRPVHTAVERSDCERLALPLLIGQG